jgi:hypothetical protein
LQNLKLLGAGQVLPAFGFLFWTSFFRSVLNLEQYRAAFCGQAMIESMGGPFRYNKKQRKRLRRKAKKRAIAADKFETEGIKPYAVPVLRMLAESDMAQAKAKKKKSKTPD